eukprot:sb/3466634/
MFSEIEGGRKVQKGVEECYYYLRPSRPNLIYRLLCDVTTEMSKQPIRTRYLGHVTGYQPIRDQYFLIRSVPAPRGMGGDLSLSLSFTLSRKGELGSVSQDQELTEPIRTRYSGHVTGYQAIRDQYFLIRSVPAHQELTEPIRTRYSGHVTGYQAIRDQYFLIRSVPAPRGMGGDLSLSLSFTLSRKGELGSVSQDQELTEPIRTRYSGHVTGYQAIRDQYFLIRSVPAHQELTEPIRTRYSGHVTGYQAIRDQYFLIRSVPAPRGMGGDLSLSLSFTLSRKGELGSVSQDQELTEPIRTRYSGHVTGYQAIRDQYFLIRSVPAPVGDPIFI